MTLHSVLRHQWKSLAAIVALTLISTAAEAAFLVVITRLGLLLGTTAETISVTNSVTLTIATGWTVAGVLAVLRLFGGLGSAWFSGWALARAAVRMRTQLVESWLGTSWEIKGSLPRGHVAQLLSSYTQTAATIASAAGRGLSSMVAMVALLTAALLVQPTLTVSAATIVALLGLAMIPLRRAVRRHTETAAAAQLDYAMTVEETETVAMEIQVLGVDDAAAKRIIDRATVAALRLRSAQFFQGAVSPLYQFIASMSLVILLILGSRVGSHDVATVGVVLLLLLRALSYAQGVQVARAQSDGAHVYLEKLAIQKERFDSAASEVSKPTHIGTPGSVISAHELTFSYDANRNALQDVSFTLHPGETVALVGPSGAGKSTLVELLLGLRSSDSQLVFGNLPLDLLDRGWWSSQIGFVPQGQQLLAGTVAENVRFFRSGISDADIRAACASAGIASYIESLPLGYDTHLGERGGRLSGGQSQRLCIARALAAQPPMLILDEPTSALDAASEGAVLDSLSLLDDTTVVLVTHRPAALDICDRVITLDGGRVINLTEQDEIGDAEVRQAS